MRIHDIAFYAAGFFLAGVLVYSLKLNFVIIMMIAALIAVLFLLIGYLLAKPRLFWLAGFSLIIILGALYSAFYEFSQKENLNIVFDKKTNFSGLVVKDPERGQPQQLTIKLQTPYSGNVLAKLQSYPAFDYGDFVNFEGVIRAPQPESYADYLAKNRIFGVSNFPKAQLVSKNNGSFLKTKLFQLKNSVINNFQKVLPAEQAAFLGGLTVGERAEFSKEFREAMAKSGTTHLVALSGYNISVIVIAVSALFSSFLSRQLTFYLTAAVILAFVLMTGAEASVVRAAIMGFLVMLANQLGRIYGLRNIITLSALVMVLVNPRILRFDIGFQLSFLALLGIVYLSPALKKFFKLKDDEGFLGWRENLSTTASAQLAVAPLLIMNFNQFSPISLLTNVLILEFIPLTMGSGFLMSALGFISPDLSLILGWLTGIFLNYELWVIRLFGGFDTLRFDLGYPLIIVYYLVLIFFILYNHDRFKAVNYLK